MHPQHSNLSSEDFSCSYESSSRSSKSSKAPVVKEKNNIFSLISKSISCKTGAFYLIYLAHFLGLFLIFQKQTLPPHRICPAIHFNLLSAKKAVKRISLSAILQPYPFENLTLYSTKIYNYLIDKPSN
jgi:hypothetical protein